MANSSVFAPVMYRLLHNRLNTNRPAPDKPPSVDEVRPEVVIRGKEFFVPEHYPKDASGRLEYDKKLIEELETKTTDVLRNMCKYNPPATQPT